MANLRKVRQVLDYVPATKLGRDRYLEALDRRLHREVLVERPLARPARDEAVRVVAADEWEAARRAREEQLLKESELEHTRDELERVLSREEALNKEIEDMRQRLAGMRTEAVEKRKVALQLVGVRRPGTAGEAQPGAWEVVDEENVLEPEPPAPEPEPNAELIAQIEREAQAAEEAIQRVEVEIGKIESELETLATEEADLRKRAGPYMRNGYTLYRRTVGRGANARDFYFFSKKAPKTGTPSKMPEGYEVSERTTGVPVLKRAGAPARKASKPKRRK